MVSIREWSGSVSPKPKIRSAKRHGGSRKNGSRLLIRGALNALNTNDYGRVLHRHDLLVFGFDDLVYLADVIVDEILDVGFLSLGDIF